jgi:hypothetical protein
LIPRRDRRDKKKEVKLPSWAAEIIGWLGLDVVISNKEIKEFIKNKFKELTMKESDDQRDQREEQRLINSILKELKKRKDE